MKRIPTALLVIAACSPTATEAPACDAKDEPAVTGQIAEGNQVVAGTPLPVPLKVAIVMTSDTPIAGVRVGDSGAAGVSYIPAQLVSPTSGRWEALLYPAELENYRVAGQLQAVVPVTAIDLCNRSHDLAPILVALGPRAGAVVKDLKIAPVTAPPDCFGPPDGQVVLPMQITADHDSTGLKVTVFGTHGTWSNGMSSMELTLAEDGMQSSASSLFTTTTPGYAVIEAAAGSVTSAPYRLTVAAPPSVTASTTTPRRGATAWLDFASAGNFDTCVVEEAFANTTTVTVVDPKPSSGSGKIVGAASVLQSPATCDSTETVRISVTFDAAAPDGATVSVRCSETFYGRSANATLTVAPQ